MQLVGILMAHAVGCTEPYHDMKTLGAMGGAIGLPKADDETKLCAAIYEHRLPDIADPAAAQKLQRLLNAGLDPNTRNPTILPHSYARERYNVSWYIARNETILHYYAALLDANAIGRFQDPDIVIDLFVQLLKHGANIELVDDRGDTPLMWLNRADAHFLASAAHVDSSAGDVFRGGFHHVSAVIAAVRPLLTK
jgi:hypothetical protein